MGVFRNICWRRVVACLLAVSGCAASWSYGGNRSEIHLRLPELLNPHPLSGRIYPQLIDPYAGRVVHGLHMDATFSTAAVYERHFHPEGYIKNEDALTSNHLVSSLRFGYGLPDPLDRLELGGVFRSYRDEERTWLAGFLSDFHDWTDRFANGNTPPRGQYDGTPEQGGVAFSGEDGEWFMNTLELYAKVQLVKDRDLTGLPAMTLTFTMRPPLSDLPFDRFGVGAALGATKRLRDDWSLNASAALTYLDLEPGDFGATNLHVNRTSGECFVGATWDGGQPGGWYFPFGLRYTSERVDFRSNRNAGDSSLALHLALAYQYQLQSGRRLEFILGVNEDIPQWAHALEPDLVVHAGIALLPGGPPTPARDW